MGTITIPGKYRSLLWVAGGGLNNQMGFLQNRITEALGHSTPVPSAAAFLSQRLIALGQALEPGSRIDADAVLQDEFAPVIKTIVLYERRTIARQVDGFRKNTQHPELHAALEERLEPFKYFAGQEWFRQATQIRIPLAEDYLTAQYLDSRVPEAQAGPKTFDPKHGVFFAPSQLWSDFPRLRDQCDSRRVPLAVVFFDVDDFKSLNTLYGEPQVDQAVLPPLMRSVEGSLFGHGTVYRYGGDEFVALVPNAPKEVLLPLLLHLRRALAAASYPGVAERPTMSSGVCELSPGSSLTEDEALEAASSAKRFAKDAGRGAIVASQADAHDGSFDIWDPGTRRPNTGVKADDAANPSGHP